MHHPFRIGARSQPTPDADLSSGGGVHATPTSVTPQVRTGAAGGVEIGVPPRGQGNAARPRTAVLPQPQGWQAAPLQAPTTVQSPATSAALQAAHSAENKLPALMDRQAQDGSIAKTARGVVDTLQQQWDKARPAAEQALGERRAALADARAGCQQAQVEHAAAQTAHTRLAQAHRQAVTDRPALALALQQAEHALANPPAPGTGPVPNPDELRLARDQARQALQQLDTTIAGHVTDEPAAARRLEQARTELTGKTAAVVSAEQAVDRLDQALAQAQRVVPAQLPAVRAYADAARDVVQAAGDARREHTTLADLSLSVAHRTRVEQDASHQDQVVGRLQAERQAMDARSQPGGDLRRRHDAATANVGQHQAALGRVERQIEALGTDIEGRRAELQVLKARSSVLRALGHGRDHPVRQDRREAVVERRTKRQQLATKQEELAQVRQQATETRRSLAGAQQQLAQVNAAIARHQQSLDACDTRIAEQLPKQQALHDELARLQAWSDTGGAARDGQQAAALDAEARAQTVRDTADRAIAPAQAAAQRIETAMSALFDELAPSGPAPKAPDAPRSALQRAADGMRGLYQGYVNRTAPTKFEVTIGPFTHTSANAGPTTFNGGQAPGREVSDAVLSQRSQKAVDAKTATSGAAAAEQMTGKPGRHLLDRSNSNPQPATPQALRSAVAFTQEVAQLFQAPAADAGTLVGLAPTVFANRLLDHPNPDPVGRHDGHPLRHEEALLIGSALSAVTSDPAAAANVYNQLWNERPALPGVAGRDPAAASPMANMATEPRGAAVSTDPETLRLAQAARRVLAGSPAGMDALMHLQGLSLPPAGDPARGEAARALEHYKLSLRAETALLGKLNVGGAQTTQDVLAAIDQAAPARRLLDASILGTGKARREDPATLASQALKYAAANMTRPAGQPEQCPEFKAAYVALRNGFTESGQGSDFNAMTRRLHKFVHYIDVAVAEKPNISTVLGRLGRLTQRVGGKEMSPLTTLLQAGPLGSDLGQVPAEYKKQLGQALTGSATLLQNHLTASMAALTPDGRTQGLTRLAALQLWNEKLGPTADPYAKIQLAEADVMQRARDLATQLNAPHPALNEALARQECTRHLAEPMQPSLLSTWVGRGATAGSLPASDELDKLRDSFAMLEGRGRFVSNLGDLQREFDGGDAATRREVLRKLLISVVAGGDMADYSDGRKNAISGRVGFSPAGVSINNRTIGITPVVEGSYEHTKSTVLRAGVASNTGVLYLGQDTRQGASLGVGVRAGLTEGLGDYSVGAIARLGGLHGASSGLMIRTNKSGTEHETLPVDDRLQSPGWKRMTEMAVNTVFDLAGAGAGKPANANAMWQGVVDRLGDYHDISFGYNRGSAVSANWSLQADGIAALRLGPDDKKTLLGTQIGVGLKHTFMNRGKARDSAGAMQAFQGSSAQRVSGAATADVGVTHPTIRTRDGGSVSLLSRSKIGVESEMIFGASSGLIRISTEDGRVNPNISFKHREYALEGDFFKLVNAQREAWAPRLGERGADGRLHGGDAALNEFMSKLADLPPGRNRLFIERQNLRPEAAETINALMARLDVLQRSADEHAARASPVEPRVKQEIEALQGRIAHEVNDEANWQPFRLFVNETNQMAQDTQLAGEARHAPQARNDPLSPPDSAAEAIRHGGGKLVLGGVVRAARAGRDLLTLDAQPEHG